jgi:hypothetical protein
MAIVTAAEVKRSLTPDMSGYVNENLIADLIAGVESDAERVSSRYLLYGTYTDTFSGDTQTKVFLKGFKIWALTKVEIDDVSYTLTDFQLHPEMAGVYYEYGFTTGVWNIEITYTAGYSATVTGKGAPDGMKRAIIDEIVLRYDYLQGQSKTGEQIVDLKKDFLNAKAEKYFKSLRRISI